MTILIFLPFFRFLSSSCSYTSPLIAFHLPRGATPFHAADALRLCAPLPPLHSSSFLLVVRRGLVVHHLFIRYAVHLVQLILSFPASLLHIALVARPPYRPRMFFLSMLPDRRRTPLLPFLLYGLEVYNYSMSVSTTTCSPLLPQQASPRHPRGATPLQAADALPLHAPRPPPHSASSLLVVWEVHSVLC